MSFDLVQILQHMDAFALTITLVLVVMGVASLAVFFERLWAYGKAAARSRAFAHACARAGARVRARPGARVRARICT